jgi:hypothetical protein
VQDPDPSLVNSEELTQDQSRAMRDVWSRTLAKIPSAFGKIVYLASLRNENTGKYQHFGLSQIYSDEDADLVLRESHEEAFREWLTFSLEPQKTDLEEYLSGLDDDRATVLDAWSTLAPYRRLIPARATEAERELYVSDLELILELLRSGSSSAT